jgi:hypothetical protein
MVGRMDREIRRFAKFYVVVAAFFFVIGVILAYLLHRDLLNMLAQVYFWMGLAYIAASTLAWSGVANMYRYSPTLFIGSRSYRQQIFRSKMGQEGRDDHAYLLGLAFGGALMGLGAALFEPLFIVVDVLAVALVLLVLHALRSHSVVKS